MKSSTNWSDSNTTWGSEMCSITTTMWKKVTKHSWSIGWKSSLTRRNATWSRSQTSLFSSSLSGNKRIRSSYKLWTRQYTMRWSHRFKRTCNFHSASSNSWQIQSWKRWPRPYSSQVRWFCFMPTISSTKESWKTGHSFLTKLTAQSNRQSSILSKRCVGHYSGGTLLSAARSVKSLKQPLF